MLYCGIDVAKHKHVVALLNEKGQVGAEKAETLQRHARQAVGVSFLKDAVRIEMRCLLDQIELLEEQRDQVEAALEERMTQAPQHLTSIPGIGLATGAALLAEIGDVSRFESVEKLVAYAGIDASVYQTGQFEASEAHMSKRAEGKHHGTALGAVCRKLLARIYIVLKEQRPYVIR